MRYEQRVPCAWLLRHEQGSAQIVGASVIKAAGAVRDTFQSYLRTVHELLAPVAFQQHRPRAWLVNHAMGMQKLLAPVVLQEGVVFAKRNVGAEFVGASAI